MEMKKCIMMSYLMLLLSATELKSEIIENFLALQGYEV